jgi:hypothetical protein
MNAEQILNTTRALYDGIKNYIAAIDQAVDTEGDPDVRAPDLFVALMEQRNANLVFLERARAIMAEASRKLPR